MEMLSLLPIKTMAIAVASIALAIVSGAISKLFIALLNKIGDNPAATEHLLKAALIGIAFVEVIGLFIILLVVFILWVL